MKVGDTARYYCKECGNYYEFVIAKTYIRIDWDYTLWCIPDRKCGDYEEFYSGDLEKQ